MNPELNPIATKLLKTGLVPLKVPILDVPPRLSVSAKKVLVPVPVALINSEAVLDSTCSLWAETDTLSIVKNGSVPV